MSWRRLVRRAVEEQINDLTAATGALKKLGVRILKEPYDDRGRICAVVQTGESMFDKKHLTWGQSGWFDSDTGDILR